MTFLGKLAEAMEKLGMTHDVPLEDCHWWVTESMRLKVMGHDGNQRKALVNTTKMPLSLSVVQQEVVSSQPYDTRHE